MIKSRKFIATTAIMITLCTSTALIGCGNKIQTQTDSSTSSELITASSAESTSSQTEGTTDIKTIVKDLVSAGTLTQDQADKINAAFEKNPNAAPGPDSPLAALVTDNTITEDQEHAILDKMFGGQGGGQGAQAGGAQAGGGLGGPTAINTQGATKSWTDVAYASTSDTEKLDIYLPNTGNGPYPVIISFHGGGFALGDKNSGESNDPLVGLNHGYAVVCVNYRLSSEATFPAAVYDAKAAVRFIKANASKYNLNPDKVGAWGDSAGGNLASLLGTSSGVSSLEDLSMGNPNLSSNVQAVVDLFGPINFSTMDAEFKASGNESSATHSSATSFESKYMGAALDTLPDKVQQANPTKYISSSTPPFFVENGSADTNVPTVQSVNFSDALKKAIGDDKVTYIQIPGAGHGTSEFDTSENLDKIFTFLDKYLK